MLGLSDRDSKIILLLLIVAVVVLPYVLYTKNLRADTEMIKGENIELQARLEELQEMNKNRDFYIAETQRMQKERDELIASFPAEIGQENYTMFLQYLEVNSILKAEENALAMEEDEDDETPPFGYKGIEGDTTFLIGSVGYNDNDYIQIGEEDSTLMGVINDSTLAFSCHYDGFRYMLDYILNYDDPMIYKKLKVEYDPDTAELSGEMMIEQWAIAGNGRKLDPVPVWEDIDELDMRGIEDTHLFGPLSPDALYRHQLFELYLEELAEEAEEEEEEEEGEGAVIE